LGQQAATLHSTLAFKYCVNSFLRLVILMGISLWECFRPCQDPLAPLPCTAINNWSLVVGAGLKPHQRQTFAPSAASQ
jgi:hypothetical protein